MSLNRSEHFLYFQNKANHYHRLRNIRSTIDNHTPITPLPKKPIFRPTTYIKQHEIAQENQSLTDRLVSIFQSSKPQLFRQGYSRYNRVQRPFRSINPLRIETQRSIRQQNQQQSDRLKTIRPAIGDKHTWNKQYSKSLNCRKNMSKYIENNKSKVSLQISTDRFIPTQLRQYLQDQPPQHQTNHNKLVTTITMEKLFELPPLHTKSPEKWNFGDFSRLRKEIEDK